MLTLYTHPMSPCSRKVRIVLAEKGPGREQREVNLPEKESLTAACLRCNPVGIVPALLDAAA